MATVRALAGDGEQIEDSELVVTSALTVAVKAFLPEIDDAAGTTVDDTYQVLVVANSSGDIEVVDIFGARVFTVQAGTSATFRAQGDLAAPIWSVVAQAPQMAYGQALTSAGSSTPALGTTGPASSGTVKWLQVILLDGTLAYVACWQ